jgi:hypothetical protein
LAAGSMVWRFWQRSRRGTTAWSTNVDDGFGCRFGEHEGVKRAVKITSSILEHALGRTWS